MEVKTKSGRSYTANYNIIDVWNIIEKEHEVFLFSIRLPTEEEAQMLMEDLRENNE